MRGTAAADATLDNTARTVLVLHDAQGLRGSSPLTSHLAKQLV